MNPIWFLYLSPFGCFLKWWVSPTTTGFPTKIDPFGVWNGGTPIFGNTHLHPWHPLTIFLDHSLTSYEAPASLQERNRLILVSSFCSEAICSSFVSSASSPGNFQRQLEISCTNDNQQQPTPTPTPNQPTDQPTKPELWTYLVSWCSRSCIRQRHLAMMWHRVQMPEDIHKNMSCLLLFCLLLQVFHQVIHVGSLENMYKVFQHTLFWGFLFQIKITPNQSSLLRQVEVFFLMILPAPQVFSSESQIVFL